MQLDQNPFFRKPITPWWDSSLACWILIVCMLVVFCFALVGMGVASADPSFAVHTWFPGLLAFLSFFLVVKVFIRVRRRARTD